MNQGQMQKSVNDLQDLDLQKVYEQGKQELLRDYAFRIRLDDTDGLESLTSLVFDNVAGLDHWTTAELLEISNRFRLFSAPDREIRIFEKSGNAEFRAIPRAREFYILALNKVGRSAEAIAECGKIIAEGGDNGLVWGILGDACSNRMLAAEKLARELAAVNDDIAHVPTQTREDFARNFPGVDLDGITLDRLHCLHRKWLNCAWWAYRRGFKQFGSTFPGFGWLLRTMDREKELLRQRAAVLENQANNTREESFCRLEAEVRNSKNWRAFQPVLLRVALEMRGGAESLDFWTHAGYLQLYFVEGCLPGDASLLLARLFDSLDADFKLKALLKDLQHIRDHTRAMSDGLDRLSSKTNKSNSVLRRMQTVLSELELGRKRFIDGGKKRRAALNEACKKLLKAEPTDSVALFLKRTINFRALTDNLVPYHIQGGIGRVGARMPDLTINRQVQDDLRFLITEKVLPALSPLQRMKPKAVLDEIRRLVGSWLGVAELQDLQSPAHQKFDARSDGLILLSGIDPAMRIGSRSITDLSAAMLLQTGDCRETMYLNGALFALYQQLQVKQKLTAALACLERDAMEEAQRLVDREIPAILRYQLRGGHVAVYVEAISIAEKYIVERVSEKDNTARERPYGIAEFMAGSPLTMYELENAKLLVAYDDGTTSLIEPRDPSSGKWRPIEHLPVAGSGGVPRIPEKGIHGGTIAEIRLLNLVEEHSLSFLYDSKSGEVELYDGFYNQLLYDSPYTFGSGHIDTSDLFSCHGMIRAGTRRVRSDDGKIRDRQVYLEFLPHSTTDCAPCLGEGDIPLTFHLMGRPYRGDFREELQRFEEGSSAIPAILEKMRAWQIRQRTEHLQRQILDQRFVRVLLELARDRPELVTLEDVERKHPLITQGLECNSVYLVLCGDFLTYQDGELLMHDNRPAAALPGTILGEISAIQGCLPTATVVGEGVVLRIAKGEFLRQLDINPVFRNSVEELVTVRLELDRLRKK
jgi:CRP-like cAMP-binding protein